MSGDNTSNVKQYKKVSGNSIASVSTSRENLSSDSITAKDNQVELKQHWSEANVQY